MDAIPKIEAMLERQARFAEVARRIGEEQATTAGPTLAHMPQGPWITISRQLGSGGEALARQLTENLGWQVYDHEIVSRISENTKTRETILAWLDEQKIGPMTDYLVRLFDPRNPGRVSFLREMARVIWGVAGQGHAVILGRGANWFLDPRFGLRLRVVAPLAARVAAVAFRDDLTEEQAEPRILENDNRQSEFIRQVYQREIDDPLGYDLTLNLGGLGLDASIDMVRAALRRKLALKI